MQWELVGEKTRGETVMFVSLLAGIVLMAAAEAELLEISVDDYIELMQLPIIPNARSER